PWLAKFAYLIQSVVVAERLAGIELPKSMDFLSVALDGAHDYPFNPRIVAFLEGVLDRKKNIDDLDFRELFD
ncbi:hypothetical protein KW795_02065, partial [Candidatus Microgenomates bacterium]|nr:hypothetical protein [Candidatus Microgenomates bacterium]